MSLYIIRSRKFIKNGQKMVGISSHYTILDKSLEMGGNNCKLNSQNEDEAAKRHREEDINAKKSRLIELVKGYSVLYDLAHLDHKNSEVKKVIWDKIAVELKEDGK